MNLHEYQAKSIFREYGIPVPDYEVFRDASAVKTYVADQNLQQSIVKIQVHAGGRGKAGGVKFCKDPEAIVKTAGELIGMKMVNNQTGPAGIVAHQVMLSDPIDIKKEYYLSITMDRSLACPILIASQEGGMEIEEVAEKSPEKILKLPLPISGNVRGFQLLRAAKFMGWEKEIAKQGMIMIRKLLKVFLEKDASLLEINPLVLTEQGNLVALDAKLSIDENASFRQKELVDQFDTSQITESEKMAQEFDLSYIALDGEIGCMVNGAGLAMATMDIIHSFGKKPANFLDVGGSATEEKVAAGFRIILSDSNVKAILVNIFGGIMNCATIAQGVISAAKTDEIEVPLIVRLEGTNVEEGRKLLNESGLSIIPAKSLAEAAEKAVEAAKKG